jgi:hypothetical protein
MIDRSFAMAKALSKNVDEIDPRDGFQQQVYA